MAHEKSRRSFILGNVSIDGMLLNINVRSYLVLIAIRCKVWPICSAMDMNRCANIVSCTGLTTSQSSPLLLLDSGRSITICDLRIETIDPDSMRIVCVASRINAGPFEVSKYQEIRGMGCSYRKTGSDF